MALNRSCFLDLKVLLLLYLSFLLSDRGGGERGIHGPEPQFLLDLKVLLLLYVSLLPLSDREGGGIDCYEATLLKG